ncbi:glycosyltransferase family 4 protein [Sphingorhabdus sp.]|uniref:glycosyltransferase family 4 protein n=1 Tax=Sphingorhabdus sp. TaxID=1902408 RepID=UPI002FD9A389
MAQDHDIIVLFGAAGNAMGDISELDDLSRAQFDRRVKFIAVHPGPLARLLNLSNRAGRLVYTFYLAYRLWHQEAKKVATRICRDQHIDLIHYLCPIGFREPGYLWKLQKPYVWGPVGGMPPYKWRLFAHAGNGPALRAFLRNILNWLQLHCSLRVRKAMLRADVLVAATSENANKMRQIAKVEPYFLPENGIRTIYLRSASPRASTNLRLIWVGRIDAGKALSILLNSLARVRNQNWQLEIIGTGVLKETVYQEAFDLGLSSHINWRGQLTRASTLEHFANADVHVLSSLAEAHSTVLWEAMAHGVPTVAFDHCGMHDSICDQCGVRVPIKSVDQMVCDLAGTLDHLISNPDEVQRLQRGATLCAQRNNWVARRQTWNTFYDLAIQRHNNRSTL